MVKVTNKSQAPQGVRFSGKLRFIKPGATAEGEMNDAELAKAKSRDFLKVDGGATLPPALTGKTKPELLAIAKDEGVETFKDGDADKPIAEGTNSQIIAAIEARRKG